MSDRAPAHSQQFTADASDVPRRTRPMVHSSRHHGIFGSTSATASAAITPATMVAHQSTPMRPTAPCHPWLRSGLVDSRRSPSHSWLSAMVAVAITGGQPSDRITGGPEVAVGRRPRPVDRRSSPWRGPCRPTGCGWPRARIAPVPVQIECARGGRCAAGVEQPLRARQRQALRDQLRLRDRDRQLGQSRGIVLIVRRRLLRRPRRPPTSTSASAAAPSAAISPTASSTNGSSPRAVGQRMRGRSARSRT